MINFKWNKLGLLFNPAEHKTPDWMNEFAQAPATLEFDEFIRVYFSTRPKSDENGQYISYSGFVDLDKDNLFKILRISENPILKLGALGCFDEFGTYPVSVIRKDSKLLAYYGGWTRCESVPFNVAIGCAVSNDNGVTFEKLGEGPILSYSKEEPFVISGPKIRFYNNKWYLFYIAGKKWILDNGKPEPVYKIRLAISDDGIVWSKVNRDIIESKLDDEAQASPDVIFLNGIYHMFFCYRGSKNYRGKENGYRIGYAYSTDLMNWTRDDSKAGIDVSLEGWDSEMISYPHVFKVKDDIYMFYLGNQVGKLGFGMAKLDNLG